MKSTRASSFVALIVFGWFAIHQNNKYEQRDYDSAIEYAEKEFRSGHYSSSKAILARYLPDSLGLFSKDIRDGRWHLLRQLFHDELATLEGHEGSVNAVAFSPDGKVLVSSSHSTIKLWDVVTRENVATLNGISVAFSPDGKTLASAGEDREGEKDFVIRLRVTATEEEVVRQRNK